MAIFHVNHPLVFTFGVLGNIISICVYLAPLPTFIKIYRHKSTLGFESLPYVVALFSATLWMYYAALKPDAILLISINSFGCVIETIYIAFYCAYASKDTRKHTAKLLAGLNGGLFSVILLVTQFLVKSSYRVQVIGWICVAFSVCVFAAPLTIVFKVVRTRSVEFMPFALSLCLTLSAIMWFAYGLFQHDWCIALPNILGFFLGMLQMILYGIYRNAKKVVRDETKVPEQIINVVMLGTPEVHPVDGNMDCGSDHHNNKNKNNNNNNNNGGAEEENEQEKINKDGEKCPSVGSAFEEPSCQGNVMVDLPVLVTCSA